MNAASVEGKKQAGAEDAAEKPASAAAGPDARQLNTADLARAILAREIKPRVADIRQLAEAVLAQETASPAEDRPVKGKKKKDKDKGKAKAAGKKDGKKHKLARIPGQKSKK